MADMTETKTRGNRNEAVGEVTSDKMNKTICVKIYRQVMHKKYGKFMGMNCLCVIHKII